MKHPLVTTLISLALTSVAFASEWIQMFDGKTLSGWKVNSENPATFSVEDGAIKVVGPRAHLFYGEDGNAQFQNFEFECEIKTAKNANSGIFIHTAYQDEGWPTTGYECQLNATQKDWRKTGSVYSFKDLKSPGHEDDQWFTCNIKVVGKTMTISINGKSSTNTPSQPFTPKKRSALEKEPSPSKDTIPTAWFYFESFVSEPLIRTSLIGFFDLVGTDRKKQISLNRRFLKADQLSAERTAWDQPAKRPYGRQSLIGSQSSGLLNSSPLP